MQDVKKLLLDLLAIPSLSGYEKEAAPALEKQFAQYFDEFYTDKTGNHVFVKKCGKAGAKRLLLDAHFDEIGMIVTDVMEGGYVRLLQLGGVDSRSMSASEVTLFADREITGIVTVPSALIQNNDDAKKLLPVKECLVYMDMTKEELEAAGVRLGTKANFGDTYCTPIELGEGQITGRALDNKAGCAAIMNAVALLDGKDLECDIYVVLSSMEETHMVGAKTSTYAIEPDEAIVVDVSFGHTPCSDKAKCVDCGKGATIVRSISLDRKLTERIIASAKAEEEIPHQIEYSPKSTGTNAAAIPFALDGVPCAVIGIPLKNMHSINETVHISDIESAAKIIARYAETIKI